MTKSVLFASLAAAGLLAGCVTVPSGPAVTVLPGQRKSAEQFRADEDACRMYAQAAIGGESAGQPAVDAAAANAVAGAALGAAVGALLGSVTGDAGAGAAWGAGTGLLFGGAAGSNVAGYSSYALQRNYDAAYVQCMYTRGNQVPGRVAARPAPRYAPGYGYPPPAYPPPSYPPPNYPPPNYPPPNYPAPSTPPSGG